MLVCIANTGSITHACFYTLANSVQYVCLKGGFRGTPGTLLDPPLRHEGLVEAPVHVHISHHEGQLAVFESASQGFPDAQCRAISLKCSRCVGFRSDMVLVVG